MYSLFFPINSSLILVLTNCCMISLIAQIVYVGAKRHLLLQLKHSARSRDSFDSVGLSSPNSKSNAMSMACLLASLKIDLLPLFSLICWKCATACNLELLLVASRNAALILVSL